MPDWEWELRKTTLAIKSPRGWINLQIHSGDRSDNDSLSNEPRLFLSLVRAGELVYPPPGSSIVENSNSAGERKITTLGWFSPTYTQKVPALSFSIVIRSPLPVNLVSQWTFPQRFSRNP
jgi:hypothetical protein